MTILRALTFALALATIAASHAHTLDVSLRRKIVLWLLYTALGAGFYPNPINQPMTHMQPLVRDGIDAIQILDPVVSSIVTFVMYLEAVRDWTVRFFPKDTMLGDNRAACQFDLIIPVRSKPACLCVFLCHTREVEPE
ncbi:MULTISPECIES: hypothetical protein [unclassified Sulfitobacter]|uniref:hypothetical protein n=1 Tax=Sulfitobacter sp. CB2047 TaxID=1525218 RepID=UPI001F1901F2|nr:MULTISPECIES: hypothetical protein [unclassified Sulfitobacter]